MGRTRWPGLDALMDRANLRKDSLTATDLVFQLAPRINAAGRMEDANEALELLLSDDPFRGADLAKRMDVQNARRRKADEDTLRRALAQVDQIDGLDDLRSLVLCSNEWHPGVIGIVASRLVERYNLPTILVAFDGDIGKGSARSIPGFDLYEAISACSDHLESFGGHQYAAGLTLAREKIESFREAFDTVARNTLSSDDLEPTIKVDIEVQLAQLTPDLLQGLKRMAPFGTDNRRPTFMARGVRAEGNPRRVGSDRAHLRFAVRRDGSRPLDVIAFRMGDRAAEIGQAPLDLVFTFEENEFRGIRRPQLRLKDMRPTPA
jgi:single-stranded-DNA-specific exonuclease